MKNNEVLLCISMPPLSLCCCYSKLLDKGVFFYSDFF